MEMKPGRFLRNPETVAGCARSRAAPENIVPREVEKLAARPYCRSRQESCSQLLSSPKLMAQHRTRNKEIGKWKPSRHNRTCEIPSSTRHERSGTISPSISSVE